METWSLLNPFVANEIHEKVFEAEPSVDRTGNGGGRILAGKLKELENALDEYFGAIAMQKEGMNIHIPDKPEALKLLEQCEVFGIPLVAGGLMNQPHIWLREVGVIRRQREIREMLESIQAGGDDAAIPR